MIFGLFIYFWEADARTFQFTYVSEQAERLLGYPLAQWFTLDFWVNHLHPDDRKWVVTDYSRAVHEKRNQRDQRLQRADLQTPQRGHRPGDG